MHFKDELNKQVDKRKVEKLVDSGVISPEELANAPILSVSECCGVDMLGERDSPILICSKCRKPCEGAEEL